MKIGVTPDTDDSTVMRGTGAEEPGGGARDEGLGRADGGCMG